MTDFHVPPNWRETANSCHIPPRHERETAHNSHTAPKSVGLDRAEITVIGPANGMSEMDIRGSYVGIAVRINNSAVQRARISVGQAQCLAQSLNGLLLDQRLGAQTFQRIPDINRLVGGIIDAYTLAPNDEDARREAVRECIERWLR